MTSNTLGIVGSRDGSVIAFKQKSADLLEASLSVYSGKWFYRLAVQQVSR
jgi:hypothetical protein